MLFRSPPSSAIGVPVGDCSLPSEQECKRRFAALFDLERQEIVGAGAPEIDRRDRDLPLRGRLHETEAGLDHQR